MPHPSDLPEFAPRYTTAESIRIVVVGALAGAAVLTLGQGWLFPWLKEFARTAHCRTVWGMDGLTVLWYGLFVGLPLHVGLLVLATLGWRGYKILRDGQFPALNEKVARPTRIRRGTAAQWIGCLHLCICIPLFALSVWGWFVAAEYAHHPIPASAYLTCTAQNGALTSQ